MIKPTTDTNLLLSKIRLGKESRDKMIKQLYYNQSLRNIIKTMIIRKGGSENDFDVVFNTSLMQFIKTVVKNSDFEISTSINSYIIGIAKYVWYAELAKRKKNTAESIENHFNLVAETTPESLVINHNQKEIIHELLLKLGKNCKEVLMYWANGYRMAEIAEMLGYKSEGMAKKKKHICFKELLAYLADKPHIKKVLQ